MALIGNSNAAYNKTGNNWFGRWANRLSYIPVFGGAIGFVVGMTGTVVESAQWLFRGKVLSAATVLAAGTVGNTVNSATKMVVDASGAISGGVLPAMWYINAGSGLVTGRTAGTHARKLTESAIGGIAGTLGAKPQVLRSFTAGMGSVGGAAPAAPGRFATQIANERGQDPNAMYANYMRGEGGVHVNELGSANGRGM